MSKALNWDRMRDAEKMRGPAFPTRTQARIERVADAFISQANQDAARPQPKSKKLIKAKRHLESRGMFPIPALKEIKSCRMRNGKWSAKVLAKWGIPWVAPYGAPLGWQQRLAELRAVGDVKWRGWDADTPERELKWLSKPDHRLARQLENELLDQARFMIGPTNPRSTT
jgi:hypothetical protein